MGWNLARLPVLSLESHLCREENSSALSEVWVLHACGTAHLVSVLAVSSCIAQLSRVRTVDGEHRGHRMSRWREVKSRVRKADLGMGSATSVQFLLGNNFITNLNSSLFLKM